MFKHMPDIMTLKEAREYLRVGRNTMLNLIHDGYIDSFRIGNRIKISKEAVIDYLKGL